MPITLATYTIRFCVLIRSPEDMAGLVRKNTVDKGGAPSIVGIFHTYPFVPCVTEMMQLVFGKVPNIGPVSAFLLSQLLHIVNRTLTARGKTHLLKRCIPPRSFRTLGIHVSRDS